MILTFRNLYEQVAAQNDERTSTDTTRDLCKEYVNAAHTQRCVEYANPFLIWHQEETLSTVADQRVYPLHQLFDRPLYFYNRTSKQWVMETPNRTLSPDEYGFDTSLTGPARNFMFWGHTGVKQQPTGSGTVRVVSTSASDTGSTYQVGVKGMNTSGELVVDVLTMNGTSTVTGAITFAAGGILSVAKSRDFNGILTVTGDSGSTTLLALSPQEFGRQYRQIYLLEAPTSAESIGYRFYRKPLFLVNDYDVPDIPAPYAQILVYDALLMWAAYNTDVSEKSIMVWREQQKRWETALNAYCAESQTLNSRSKYVRDTDGQFLFGRGNE
jgi:hypothetical protein